MLHPDWLVGSNFRLRGSDNLQTGYHQNSWISSSQNETSAVKVILFSFHKPQTRVNSPARLLRRQLSSDAIDVCYFLLFLVTCLFVQEETRPL